MSRPASTTRCTSVFSPKLVVAPRPSENPAPCLCGQACPASSFVPLKLVPEALIISASGTCFARARTQAEAGGFRTARRINAEFVDENHTMVNCCKDGKCGRGRRSKPAHRARIDGIVRAHRRAWQHAVRDNLPKMVFEDDAELLGSAHDVSYAIGRCERTPSCGIALLGVAFTSYLLSHAYYVKPPAARLLLRRTKELCNLRAQDYTIQWVCQYNQTNCTLPPRGLYRPDTGRGAFQGWGLYVQNTRAVVAYNSMINYARGGSVAGNWSAAAAHAFQRC